MLKGLKHKYSFEDIAFTLHVYMYTTCNLITGEILPPHCSERQSEHVAGNYKLHC